MNTGKRIKELRLIKNITQKELAEKVGTRENYISDIENGKRKAGEKMLTKIADVFGMSYMFFLIISIDIEKDLKEDEFVCWYQKVN